MKILRFIVNGLNSRKESIDIEFNEDITIFVGRNGSGKTTILKLLWFMISGNLERISGEIDFESADLWTDRYRIIYEYVRPSMPERGSEITKRVIRRSRTRHKPYKIVYYPMRDGEIASEGVEFNSMERDLEINDLNSIVASSGSSVFFPTFRRFEGGYSIDSLYNSRSYVGPSRQSKTKLDELIAEISDAISVDRHKFVISFSAADITQMVTNHYAQASAQYQEAQGDIGRQVIEDIRRYKYSIRRMNDSVYANELIESIESKVNKMESDRGIFMEPIFVLTDFMSRILNKSVDIFGSIDIMDNGNSIPIDALSAGEKQMVSFLCYNAFYNYSPIFIDEPELSLNGDWQRLLFKELERQNPTNQYILSTHSPFVYSAFRDKTINLNTSGDLGE